MVAGVGVTAWILFWVLAIHGPGPVDVGYSSVFGLTLENLISRWKSRVRLRLCCSGGWCG